MRHSMVFGIVVLLGGVTGCAGARTHIMAPSAEVPVSMSRGVRDADGSLVPGERRKVVAKFETKERIWGMVYSAVSLTPQKDISAAVNQQVKEAKGDAVINLRIGAAQCGLNLVPFFDALPFWPGCSNLKITGDIIQVAPPAAPPPPPAPPEPVKAATNDAQKGGDAR